jgi:formylglycine-generating enzyme required for sulfatase activity
MPSLPSSAYIDEHFLVNECVGFGATSDVWHVTRMHDRRHMVLRIRRRGDASKTTPWGAARARFMQEAHLGVALNNQHLKILGVHEFVELDDALVLVTDFAPNRSAADLLFSTRQPPIDRALQILYDAAQGLDDLHMQGIVHRDVKPTRILLTADGPAQIGGLGLAQTNDSLSRAHAAHPGSPGYMSPEHASPQALTPTSDVYSLGCVAFELLTGQRWAVQQNRVTAPSMLRPEIPPWIDELVLRMLRPLPGLRADDAADPTRRFVHMQYVLDALRRRGSPDGATSTSIVIAESPRQRSDEMREATIIEQMRWLQARVAAAESKAETLQRVNVDLSTQMRMLRETTLPRRTFIAGIIGVGIGVAAKWAGDLLFGSTNVNIALQSMSYAAPADPLAIATPPPLVATATFGGVTPLTLAPDVTLDLLYVQAGPFLMGSKSNEDGPTPDDEIQQHVVELAEYWIGRTEVTVAQFAAFVRATGHRTQAEKDGESLAWIDGKAESQAGVNWAHPRGLASIISDPQNTPVTHVSWDDAMAFCNWLGRMTGLNIDLPSEAEWEKAARSADGRRYPWGNEAPESNRANYGLFQKSLTPVGRYDARFQSPYGAVDMAGNVWEWTHSQYRTYPYSTDDGREDVNSDAARVMRGGAFDSTPDMLRVAHRASAPPTTHAFNIGFRVRARRRTT